MPAEHVCKDCRAEGLTTAPRPAPHPGPRCVTHHRAKRKRDKERAHGLRVEAGFNISKERYDQLKAFQGGVCALCRRATGATKRLAVDHDHSCCAGKTSCGKCVRGLLCGPCNSVLSHARDDVEFFRRAVEYLLFPPARSCPPG